FSQPVCKALCVSQMKRVACSVIAFILATVIAEQLLGDVAVYFEMWSVGASSRAELADDFGLGLLWLLIVLPGSIIVGAISSWVTWIVLKKESGSDSENT
ncbi:hypothetical protein ABIE61_003799, partial [Marinobacterium sp. MBR-111]|uniref:hypothetical protein n=1 Tax=Marinobacterium sp. MBR-111 TaxID=3156463 RepID=UPI003399A5EB